LLNIQNAVPFFMRSLFDAVAIPGS